MAEALLQIAPFYLRLLAEQLMLPESKSGNRLLPVLTEAAIALHPHQLEAAVFALDSLPRGGCILADEVGLGKTIEAGLVIAQLISEGKSRILVLCPASLRAQWQAELLDKFGIAATIVDGRTFAAQTLGVDTDTPVVVASHPFAAQHLERFAKVPWDLAVIDEAHRLRNAYRPTHRTGRAIQAGLRATPKILLTATPLQNSLLDLFGLAYLLGADALGPEEAFRARFVGEALTPDAAADLHRRLKPLVHRTLRRQVREYVPFPQRRSLVEDFHPSAEEQTLYEDVSDYLRRPRLAALPPGKRTLLTLVYRKLLASSTFAIAPTLAALAARLEERIRMRPAQGDFWDEELLQFPEEVEALTDEVAAEIPLTPQEERRELEELRALARRAANIRVNAKGEALKHALDRIFTVASASQSAEKVVVFTESRRTVDYLFDLLSEAGWRDRISKLTGDAATPEQRHALIAEFEQRTAILLSTEAGAEGLNLQFCNLVINFDLPWNPQRIEQRIGRCHRYGQARDVVVLNFLNRANAADARLHEILKEKLGLFDGVFGASDEVLGALGSGVDFEKRVLGIYQSCRSPQEIEAGFAVLQADLREVISHRMRLACNTLLERFDADVRARMKLTADWTERALAKRRSSERFLIDAVLRGERSPPGTAMRAAQRVKATYAEVLALVSIGAATLPPRLQTLRGSEGWWFAYRFVASGVRPQTRLVHIVLRRDGSSYQALPMEDAELLLSTAVSTECYRKPSGASPGEQHDLALGRFKEEFRGTAQRANGEAVLEFKEAADRRIEDGLYALRHHSAAARERWDSARAEAQSQRDLHARLHHRSKVERTERDYRWRLERQRTAEHQRYDEKDRTIAALVQSAQSEVKATLVATAYFWVA